MLYIKSLEIENVRCFGKKQKVDFTDADGNIAQWTVILGDNGTGKTSVLRSIVGLLPPPEKFLESKNTEVFQTDISIDNIWKNQWSLKRGDGNDNSVLVLYLSDSLQPFEIGNLVRAQYIARPKSTSNTFFEDGKYPDKIFCFAYGANRKMAEKSFSDKNFLNASETLFKDDALLPNSSEFFLRVDYEASKSGNGNAERDRIKHLLIKVLPSGIQDIEVFSTGRLQQEVRVKTDFGWVNLNELSLGYKTTIAWLIDFASKMIYYHEKSENPFNEPAVLIIDEIDLHMHPAWQREIIEQLTELFPKTQFIVTAHSPLIAQAALNSNLVLLKNQGDHVVVENNPEIIKSWRIDQILTSDLFGLKGARAPEVEKKMNRRVSLLKKEKLTPREATELEKLNAEVYDMPIGETKSEMDAMAILKDFALKLEAVKNR